MPVTFYVEMADPTNAEMYQLAMQSFTQFWQSLESHRTELKQMEQRLLSTMAQSVGQHLNCEQVMRKLD